MYKDMYALEAGGSTSPRTGREECLLEEEDSSRNIDMSKPRTMPRSALLKDKCLVEGFVSVGGIAPTCPTYECVSSGRKQRIRRVEPTSPTGNQPKDGHCGEPADYLRKTIASPSRKLGPDPLSVSNRIKSTYDGLGSQFYDNPAQTILSPAIAKSVSIAGSESIEVPVQPCAERHTNSDKMHASHESSANCQERSQGLPNFVQLNIILKRALTLLDLDLTEHELEHEELHESDYEDVIPESLCVEIWKKICQNFLQPLTGTFNEYPDFNFVATVGSAAPDDSPDRSMPAAEPSTSNSSGQRKGGRDWKGERPQRSGEKSPGEHSEESGGSGSGESDGQRLRAILNSENHELACPYNKLDPDKFCRGSVYDQKYQTCSNSFKDTAALIQHFRDRHFYNDRVCIRCHKQFGTKRTFEDHQLAERRCSRRPAQAIEEELPLLPRSERRRRLVRVGKRKSNVSNEQQWCRIWNALFPDRACPDPYRKLDSLEKEYDRAVDALIPGWVYDLVSIRPELDMDTAQIHCRRLTDAIRDRLHPFFEICRGQSAEPVNTGAAILGVNVRHPPLPFCFTDLSSTTSQVQHAAPQDQRYNDMPMDWGSNALGTTWTPYDVAVDNAWRLSQSDLQPQNDFSTSIETLGPAMPHLPLWTPSGEVSDNHVDPNMYQYLPGTSSAFQTPPQNMPGQSLS